MKTRILWCTGAVLCVAAHLLDAVRCAQENEGSKDSNIIVIADGVDYEVVVDKDAMQNIIKDKTYVIEKVRHTTFGPGTGVMVVFFFSRHDSACRHSEISSKIKSDPDVEKNIQRVLNMEGRIADPLAMFALMRFGHPASSLSYSVGKYVNNGSSGVKVDENTGSDDDSESNDGASVSFSGRDNEVSESGAVSGAPRRDDVMVIKRPYHAIDIEQRGDLIRETYCCVKGHDLEDIDFCYCDCDCVLEKRCVLPGPFVANN